MSDALADRRRRPRRARRRARLPRRRRRRRRRARHRRGRPPYRAPAALQGVPARRDRRRRAAARGDRLVRGPRRRGAPRAAVAALDPGARRARWPAARARATTRCVLATGAEPARLPGRRARTTRACTCCARSSDARALRERAAAGAQRRRRSAPASSAARPPPRWRMRGLAVTLVADEHVPHARAARRGGRPRGIAGWLEELGVGCGSARRSRRSTRAACTRPAATPLDADLVLLAAGVRPRGELAAAAGLAPDDGRIVADERMRTSAAGVLAAGDVALARNALAGRPLHVEHWGEALDQGEVAGRDAAGDDARVGRRARASGRRSATRTLKYAAWGDGFDEARLERARRRRLHGLVRRATGVAVGVLAHERDEDYERGPRADRARGGAAVTAARSAPARGLRRRARARRGGARRRLPARARGPGGVRPRRLRGAARARPLHATRPRRRAAAAAAHAGCACTCSHGRRRGRRRRAPARHGPRLRRGCSRPAAPTG